MLCFSDFPNFRTIGERGTTEIHTMTNARGLPILLHNDKAVSKYHHMLKGQPYISTPYYHQMLIKTWYREDFN
jgi:hypothetical protein